MKARVPGEYDADAVSLETGLRMAEDEVIYTVQADKDDCDINVIMQRFGLGYQMPENVYMPQYGSFEDAGDFQSAMEAVRGAQESFMSLPPEVRARFNNDPHTFVEWCADDHNYDEAKRMGLVHPADVPAPIVVSLDEASLKALPGDPAPSGGVPTAK